MNDWHESNYGYKLGDTSLELEKLLRIKYDGVCV